MSGNGSDENEKAEPVRLIDVIFGLFLVLVGLVIVAAFTLIGPGLSLSPTLFLIELAALILYFVLVFRWAIGAKRRGIVIGLVIGVSLVILLAGGCIAFLNAML